MMRIYIPRSTGLGAKEIFALKKLSRPSLEIIADELTEPGSHEAIRWILRQRNPERALAETIAENIHRTLAAVAANPNAGMGDLLGKNFFKKLHKIVKKVLVTAPKKLASKIASKDPLYKATANIRKKVMNTVRKNLPIILTVAGAVLAPFTGGASLAVASALVVARQLYVAKIEADKAKRAGKAEAASMQAAVDAQEAELARQVADIYNENKDIFLAAGYDEARWNSLTLDQKVDVIQQASNGTLKPTPEAIAAQQAAQQQISQTVTQVATSTAAAQIPQTQERVAGGSGTPSYGDFAKDPNLVVAATPPVAITEKPVSSVGSEQTDETTGLPSASGYTVNVEGQPITNYPVDLTTLSSIIASGTQPGDRFEIMADGRPTGLRVRTASGFISIPNSQRVRVMAMPSGQVLALLQQAAANVSAAGGPEGQDPVAESASSGGGSWGLLAALAAGGLALASSGKRR